MFGVVEQDLLLGEFLQYCQPSSAMNRTVFKTYILAKGLHEEKLEDTFRYVNQDC